MSRNGRVAFAAVAVMGLAGCGARTNSLQLNYPMGEKVPAGPLTYTVVDASWRPQLGEGFKIRAPQQRFLLVTLSITNGGGKDMGLPLLALEDASGRTYMESESGEGLEDWMGLLRRLSPAQTQQGKLIFDVALGSYKLRVTDGGEPGNEKFVYIEIPMRIDADSPVQTPMPGSLPK